MEIADKSMLVRLTTILLYVWSLLLYVWLIPYEMLNCFSHYIATSRFLWQLELFDVLQCFQDFLDWNYRTFKDFLQSWQQCNGAFINDVTQKK